jgi:hypothetical protein
MSPIKDSKVGVSNRVSRRPHVRYCLKLHPVVNIVLAPAEDKVSMAARTVKLESDEVWVFLSTVRSEDVGVILLVVLIERVVPCISVWHMEPGRKGIG